MAQAQLYYFLSPDFVTKYHDSLLTTNGREVAVVIPVFYKNMVDFSVPVRGSFCTFRGSEFDLMASLKFRFSPYVSDIYKYKFSDIYNLAASNRYNVICPVAMDFISSGIFKFFFVVYLSK